MRCDTLLSHEQNLVTQEKLQKCYDDVARVAELGYVPWASKLDGDKVPKKKYIYDTFFANIKGHILHFMFFKGHCFFILIRHQP